MSNQPNNCEYCGMSKEIRNPSGYCDHLYYPELVNKSLKINNTMIKPWNYDSSLPELTIGWLPAAHIKDKDGYPIADVKSVKDADYIVKCVNSHEELVNALKKATQSCPCSIKERLSGHRIDCWTIEVEEALKNITEVEQ